LSDERFDKLSDELGDVLWYVAALASELGVPLEAIARRNLRKLHGRRERGTLQGSGER
jgi:NTP pyrophosphatase (non-canonical NTP hydrolase)